MADASATAVTKIETTPIRPADLDAVLELVEFDFWTSRDAQATAPDQMRGWFDVVHGLAAAYDGRITTFAPDAALFDGITALPFSGHTTFLVESAGERLLFWVTSRSPIGR